MKLKIVKGLVVVLTFAIFFGLTIMVTLFTGGVDKPKPTIDRNVSINQPLGSSIKNILTKDNYMYIVVSGGSLSDRIVILDTNDGKIVSSISLN